mgnify:CR=1 FL=1
MGLKYRWGFYEWARAFLKGLKEVQSFRAIPPLTIRLPILLKARKMSVSDELKKKICTEERFVKRYRKGKKLFMGEGYLIL